MTPRPCLLFVDDRPTTLTTATLRRDDIDLILLRWSDAVDCLPPSHREATASVPAFVVDARAPVAVEADRFRDWLRSRRLSADHFLNPSEAQQQRAHAFARAVGLDALSAEQTRCSRDKFAMKGLFQSLGFRVAAHRLVRRPDEVIGFARHHGWPVVVKPRDGFSCIDTFAVASVDDLLELPMAKRSEWLVEEFVPHREWECCALVHDGVVLDCYPVWLPAPPLAAADGAINGSVSARHTSEEFRADINAVMQRLADGMGIRQAYMHLDFFLGDDRDITLGEVALRPAGIEIPANHGMAWGFPMFDAIVDISMGRRPPLEYTEDRYVGDLLLPIRSGLVRWITPLDELLDLDGVLSGRLKVSPGDEAAPQRAAHTSAGYVHVHGASIGEVEQRMRAVLDTFDIVVDSAVSC